MNQIPKARTFGAAAIAVLLGGFAFTALAAFVPGGFDDDTTVSIKTAKDATATVVHVPDLAVGESRTIRSESGKDVVVTRTEDGLTVNVNGRDVHVRTPGDLPGVGEDVKTIVSGDGMKRVVVTRHGYGFTTGDGDAPAMSAAELLEKHPLEALDGADARTKETVAKALEELVKKHVVIAPGMQALPGADDGDRVEVRVMKHGEK